MEFLTEHWLSAGAGLFLLSMVLYGHYRGFLRMAVSLLALIISVIVVSAAMPHVTRFLNENTTIHQAIGRGLLELAGAELSISDGDGDLSEESFEHAASEQPPSLQREIIEHLKLPEQMKESLLEHNNSEIYAMLGVDAFLDYLSSYLAHMVFNLIGAVVLFLLVNIGIRFIIKWLDLIARLPILHGINQIAGAILGGVQGLFLIWFLALIVSVCSEMQWTQVIQEQIAGSWWLRFLYENNVFNWFFITILNSLAS